MPNMKAMEDDEKEESKREKIKQILKAGTKAAAKVALEEAGAEVEAEDDDECGALLLDVSVGFSTGGTEGKATESFTVPYGTDAEKFRDFAELVGKFMGGERSQEGFDELTKESCMAEFWTFGRNELFRAMETKGRSGRNFPESIPNWNSYRHIAKFTFATSETADRLALPENLAGIGRGAFMGCRMKEVRIPDTVLSIGADAFRGCARLRKVDIPARAKIGSDAFRGCRIRSAEAENLSIRDGVAYGGRTALYMADRKARNISIAAGTEKIAAGAFKEEDIKSVILPDGLREIGRNAFRGCARLRKVAFPDRMTSIGTTAFTDCRSIKRVRLPSRLLVLGAGAFRGCRGLRRVEADEGPEIVSRGAFKDCPRLRDVRLDKAGKVDEDAFG